MSEEAVQPNALTFGTAIHLCEKGSQWQEALTLLQHFFEDQNINLKLAGATFNAGMKAAKRGGQWPWAMLLLQLIEKGEVEARQASFEMALDLCAKAQQWHFTLEVFTRMQEAHFWPSQGHFEALIQSCEKTGSWLLALEVLERAEKIEDPKSLRLARGALRACQTAGQHSAALQLKQRLEEAKIQKKGRSPKQIELQIGTRHETRHERHERQETPEGGEGPSPKQLILDSEDPIDQLRWWLQHLVAPELAQRRHRLKCRIRLGSANRGSRGRIVGAMQGWRLWPQKSEELDQLDLELRRGDLQLLQQLDTKKLGKRRENHKYQV